MDVDKIAADVEQFWREVYARPFMEKDAARYADAFGFPCMIRTEDLPRKAFSRRPELLEYCREMLRRAEESTWDRTEVESFSVRVLEPEVAYVSAEASRYNAKGERISRVFGSYTVNKDEGRWRMVAVFGGFLPD